MADLAYTVATAVVMATYIITVERKRQKGQVEKRPHLEGHSLRHAVVLRTKAAAGMTSPLHLLPSPSSQLPITYQDKILKLVFSVTAGH